MGLINLLKKLSPQKNNICVLVLGLEGSGKTALIHLFIDFVQNSQNSGIDVQPTTGVEIIKTDFKGYHFNFWDVGGSENCKSYWSNYFGQADIIMWVIDSSNEELFEESKKELESVLMNDLLDSKPLIIVSNKMDSDNSAKFPDFIRDLQINVGERNWTAIASACKGENAFSYREEIEKCLEWIIDAFSSK